MAQGTANVPAPGAPLPSPTVSVELRTGSAPPTVHEVHEVNFLIGTVPGCDLRLPGAGLPSVVCLLSRQPTGLMFRKLAPVLSITVNGTPASAAKLADGDRIKIGSVELCMRIPEDPSVGWVESSRPTAVVVDFEDSSHPPQDSDQARQFAERDRKSVV